MPSETKTLHALLRGSYGTKWDADTDSAAKMALGRMMDEFGPDRTKRAVLGCIEREAFFSVAALRTHVPAGDGSVGRDCCELCACVNGFVAVEYGTERVIPYAEVKAGTAGKYRMRQCTHPGGIIIPKEKYA